MSGNFKEAADFAAKLVKESAWSPAIYTWMQAVALVIFDRINNPINHALKMIF